MKRSYEQPAWCRRLGVAALFAALASGTMAQLGTGGAARDFRFPEYDKKTNQLRSLLTGRGARQLANGTVELTDMRLETYDYGTTPRATNFVVEAPHCVLDLATRVATSPGRMQAWKVDGQFAVSGAGYEFRQLEGRLTISNNVRTVYTK